MVLFRLMTLSFSIHIHCIDNEDMNIVLNLFCSDAPHLQQPKNENNWLKWQQRDELMDSPVSKQF